MMPRPRLQEEFAYHAPVLKKVASPAEKFLQAVLVAVVGTGLGISVGVFLAGRTLPTSASAAAEPTPAVGTASFAGTTATQAKTDKAPVVSPGTVTPTGIRAPEARVSGARNAQVSEPATAAQPHYPRLVPAALTGIRVGYRHRHGLRVSSFLTPAAFLKPTPPPIEEARLEVPDGRFRFTIEGDETAVAYDASTGVVSTDGSGMFVVDKAPGEGATVHSEESPSNVHYKCDQDANCSLIMASVVVPHARMQTVSQINDAGYFQAGTDGQLHDGAQQPVLIGHVSR